jgi:dTDP-4-dehydrorhamnose 3,5-epimerase
LTKPGQDMSFTPPPTGLRLADFKPDAPWPPAVTTVEVPDTSEMIDGVSLTPLTLHSDSRGSLTELLTLRDGGIEPIVHVYQVTAHAGSCRAWIYHRLQDDRLAFTNGRFRIVLYDIRENSPTRNMLNVFTFGAERPMRLVIPSLVIHGVKNIGDEASQFHNLPTSIYNPRAPDKHRLPWDDPRIPYSFAEQAIE